MRAARRAAILRDQRMFIAQDPDPAGGPPVRVLAVDDSPAFLAVLADLVNATAHFEIVGAEQSGENAIEAARRLRPDLVLIDVHMPGMGGIEAARRIKATRASPLVVLISTTHPDELPQQTSDSHAHTVVWKSKLKPSLLAEIWHTRDMSAS